MKTKTQILCEIECKNAAYKAFATYERKMGVNIISLRIK